MVHPDYSEPTQVLSALKLDSLEALLISLQQLLPSDDDGVTVEFVDHINDIALLSGGEHVYDDPYCVVQLSTGEQGYAFMHPKDVGIQSATSVVGKRVSLVEATGLPPYLLAALADALAPRAMKSSAISCQTYRIRGTGSQKSKVRAELLAKTLLQTKPSRLAIIGGIEDIVRQVERSVDSIRISDFYLSGSQLNGIPVECDTEDILDWCDVALITGNILKTQTVASTVDRLLEGKQAIIYSMTGHNLWPQLLPWLPFTCIFAESFPFYWYSETESIIRIYSATTMRKPTVW